MTGEQIAKVEQQFRQRLEAHGVALNTKRPSAKVLKMQAEFFTGAMAAIVAVEGVDANGGAPLPPKWVISIMSGRSILDELPAQAVVTEPAFSHD